MYNCVRTCRAGLADNCRDGIAAHRRRSDGGDSREEAAVGKRGEKRGREVADTRIQERAICRSPRAWLESSAHLSDDGLQRDARPEAARGRRTDPGGRLRNWIPEPEFKLLSFAQGDISERIGQGARES